MNIEHKHWYVCHAPDTKIQELVKKMKLTIGEENVMFPVASDRKLNRRTNEFVEKEYPLYYNYIFIRLGETDKKVEEFLKEKVNSHISILSHPGDEKWSKLSDDEIRNVKSIVSEAKKDALEVNYDFTIGDKVKILIGPFKFFNGTVSDINKKKRTVAIQVYIFGRETLVEVDGEGIEKIK